MIRHFLDLCDISAPQLRFVLDLAASIKAQHRRGATAQNRPLAGKMLAMIFQQPSTRTRVSFDVGMRQLGGETIVLSGADMQIGRGEEISDTAKVLSRFVDAIMVRMLDHAAVKTLANHASVPVINALTKVSHPCQILADILTFEEHRGPIRGRTIAWVGDANNVLTSWVHAAGLMDFTMRVACPKELAPQPELLAWAKSKEVRLEITRDPREAVQDSDCVVTDAWVSMGDVEGERQRILAPYQVDAKLMALAEKDAIFMHCLPAHRGQEVTAEVLDGPRSVVFDEAENRLHAQKGLLVWCLEAERAYGV